MPLPPVRISRREAFSFALARKLLAQFEGTPLHLDMRSVLDKIAESLEGDITIEPDWLSEHVLFHACDTPLYWTAAKMHPESSIWPSNCRVLISSRTPKSCCHLHANLWLHNQPA